MIHVFVICTVEAPHIDNFYSRLLIQGGPEKKPETIDGDLPPHMTFSLSHLSICVSFLERFN